MVYLRRQYLYWILVGVTACVLLSVAIGAVSASDSTQNVTIDEIDTETAEKSFGTEENATITSASSESADYSTTTSSNIRMTQELSRVTSQKGIVQARQRYQLPSHLRSLEVTIPEQATVQGSSGFRQQDTRTFEWTGVSNPELTFRFHANRSIDQTGPIAGPGRLIFADVGSWAVVSEPAVSHRWGWSGGDRIGFDHRMTTNDGATGEVIAYLGPHQEYTRTANGQKFRLIVPTRANLVESPNDLLDALADASHRLRVGERDEEVFMIATPTARIDWGVRGLATGPADMWVRDIESLADPDSVWLHEYVHTRQNYATSADTRWTVEGVATYYAALLALEQGHISFEQFRDRLAIGSQSRYGSSVLADPATWASHADYNLGALVSGEIDRRIRGATDRKQSLDEVIRRMNAQNSVVSASDFRKYIEETATKAVGDLGHQYTQSTTHPKMWTKDQHNAAFDGLPAQITFSLSEQPDAVRVSGEYRSRSLGPERPVVLVPGETVSFDISAENFGGQTGEYTAILRIDGSQVATKNGILDPGQREVVSFDRTFNSVGSQLISVGDVQIPVQVREPAALSVSSLSIDQSSLAAPGNVTVSVTLENTATYPGMQQVTLTRNGLAVDSQTVRLDANSEETISFESSVTAPGTWVFGLGTLSAKTTNVTVAEPETDDQVGTDETTEDVDTSDEMDDIPATADDDGAGLSVVIAVVAIIGGSLLVGMRRQR